MGGSEIRLVVEWQLLRVVVVSGPREGARCNTPLHCGKQESHTPTVIKQLQQHSPGIHQRFYGEMVVAIVVAQI